MNHVGSRASGTTCVLPSTLNAARPRNHGREGSTINLQLKLVPRHQNCKKKENSFPTQVSLSSGVSASSIPHSPPSIPPFDFGMPVPTLAAPEMEGSRNCFENHLRPSQLASSSLSGVTWCATTALSAIVQRGSTLGWFSNCFEVRTKTVFYFLRRLLPTRKRAKVCFVSAENLVK